MSVAFNLAKKILFRMDAENAHGLTLKALKSGLVPSPAHIEDDPALNVTLWNRKFDNPVGLAAGFDKNAEVVHQMLGLGFGFVEVGTVTPRPQSGNPRPRVFRDVENEAVINAMGFPNEGMNAFQTNMESFLSRRPRAQGLVGLNIGMNKTQTEPAKDYTLLAQKLGALGDYVTVNISSPNTPGLRDLQERGPFMDLMGQISSALKQSCGSNPPPLLVKFAPDLSETQLRSLARAVMDVGVDGVILTNTTLDRPDYLPAEFRAHKGGLSGRPVKDKATQTIRAFYRMTDGHVPIIGLGGISSGRDAYEKIRAGASLIQIYTALIYQGPALIHKIKQDLLQNLHNDGFSHITEAIGADH
jgi:dihydroorotate dehydrogenase